MNAYLNCGKCYSVEKDYDKAIAQFIKCLEINNNILEAVLGLALSYYYKDDFVNSKKYFEKSKTVESRLNKGMEGIAELEKEGHFFSHEEKQTLKKLFSELN
jgi:tetratricopeptide (TPR) repeat protein